MGIGVLIISISTVIYGLLPVLFKKANQSLPPFAVMAISMFALFLVSFILSVLFEKSFSWKYLSDNKNIFLFLIMAGLINAVGFWLAIQAFKYMPLWQQALFGLLAPVFTGIFAYFILGEALSLKLFVGLAIMGIGLFVAVR